MERKRVMMMFGRLKGKKKLLRGEGKEDVRCIVVLCAVSMEGWVMDGRVRETEEGEGYSCNKYKRCRRGEK